MMTIVFDLDGTLVDTSNLVLTSFQYTLGHFGIDVDDNTIEEIRTRNTENLFDGFIDDHQKPEAFSRLIDISSQNAKKSPFFPGIEELLLTLKERGYKLAVWTGRDTASSLEIIKNNNFDKFFKIVVGNSCVTKNKPHPEGLIKITEELKSNVDKFIMIGDHAHDIQGAKSHGVKSVLALWSYPSEDCAGFDSIGADYVAKNPSDVLKYIDTLPS